MTSLTHKLFAASVLAGAVAMVTSVSHARLPDAFSHIATEIVKQAVHIPTGCMASVTLDDRNLISAAITDPDCLPKGVKARIVPGGMTDFSIIETSR